MNMETRHGTEGVKHYTNYYFSLSYRNALFNLRFVYD
ncbi:hypothetical protein E2C01_092943 [Portunus trituberculatus]|uniref:Uncharacterized protein n=1 Tax=Portunus trituberculatus TaxID=210409 RepID=A0A5B7JS17_PORTR|nr:hypothetical protein [Portunus trituberculatus]